MNPLARIADIKSDLIGKIEALDAERLRLTAELRDIETTERVWHRYLADAPQAPAATPTEPVTSPPPGRESVASVSRRMSQTDIVLAIVRSAAPGIVNRQAIIDEAMRTYGVMIKKDAVTTALIRWKERGRVESTGRDWRYIEAGGESAPTPENTEPSDDESSGGSGVVGGPPNGLSDFFPAIHTEHSRGGT